MSDHGTFVRSVRLAALAMVLVASTARAADGTQKPSGPVGAGGFPITFTQASAWFVREADDQMKSVAVMVYFEGEPGWHDRDTKFKWEVSQSPATIDMTVGSTPIHLAYWQDSTAMELLGGHADLTRDNVFLVRGVDTARPVLVNLGYHDLNFQSEENPGIALLIRDGRVRDALVGDSSIVHEERRPKAEGTARALAWDRYGLELLRRGEADSACAQFRRAADTGYAPAQYRLGYCYESGHGAAKEEATANAWYLKAANQGQVDAQFKLGYSYRVGRGTKIDLPEALRWYKAAAASGDLDALYAVGYMIANGQGVAADKTAAHAWYLRAAGEGSAPGQYELVRRLHEGDGVAKDPAGAYAWLLVLRAQSKELTPDAARMLDTLGHAVESDVDPTARAAAELRAQALMQTLAKRYVARLGR